MEECFCLEQSRGDLHWQGDFNQIRSFDKDYGNYSFSVTVIQCTRCLRRYEVMADDTPAYRTIYEWSMAGPD